jgi:hypothetical protein
MKQGSQYSVLAQPKVAPLGGVCLVALPFALKGASISSSWVLGIDKRPQIMRDSLCNIFGRAVNNDRAWTRVNLKFQSLKFGALL